MKSTLPRGGALLLFAVVVLAWGFNWPVTKMIVHSISPLWTAALRSLIATVALLCLLSAQGNLIVPRRGDLPVVFGIALPHMVAFSALVAIGIQFVPAGRAIVLGYTTPLWVIPAARLFLGEPITRRHLLGGASRSPAWRLAKPIRRPSRLGRRAGAAGQRSASAGSGLLGRQHRLCPGAPLDIDAVPARLLGSPSRQPPAGAFGNPVRRHSRHRMDARAFPVAALWRRGRQRIGLLGHRHGQQKPARRHDLAGAAGDASGGDPERRNRSRRTDRSDVAVRNGPDRERYRARDDGALPVPARRG